MAKAARRSTENLARARKLVAVEHEEPRALQRQERSQASDRIQIVGVHDHEGPGCDEGLGRDDRVSRATRLVLHGPPDGDSRRPELLRVSAPQLALFRAHDQAHLPEAGIGQRTQNEVEERAREPVGASNRHHALLPRVSGGALGGRERWTVLSGVAHAAPEAAREDDRDYFAAHSLGTTRASTAPLTAKTTMETIDAVVCPSRTCPIPNSAL